MNCIFLSEFPISFVKKLLGKMISAKDASASEKWEIMVFQQHDGVFVFPGRRQNQRGGPWFLVKDHSFPLREAILFVGSS